METHQFFHTTLMGLKSLVRRSRRAVRQAHRQLALPTSAIRARSASRCMVEDLGRIFAATSRSLRWFSDIGRFISRRRVVEQLGAPARFPSSPPPDLALLTAHRRQPASRSQLPYFKPQINMKPLEVVPPPHPLPLFENVWEDDEPTQIHPFISTSARVINERTARPR